MKREASEPEPSSKVGGRGPFAGDVPAGDEDLGGLGGEGGLELLAPDQHRPARAHQVPQAAQPTFPAFSKRGRRRWDLWGEGEASLGGRGLGRLPWLWALSRRLTPSPSPMLFVRVTGAGLGRRPDSCSSGPGGGR